jgi:hypothetical protein
MYQLQKGCFMKRLQYIAIFSLCAMVSMQTVVAHKHDQIKEELKKQESIDSAKAGILARLLVGVIAGGTVAAVSRTDSLRDTALGTGLLVSSVPLFIGAISSDKETQHACYSMALAAPVIATVGGVLVSRPVYCEGGLLDRATIVNGDKFAEIIRNNPPAQSVAALVALGAVGSYLPIKSSLDRLSHYILSKGAQVSDFIKRK